LSELVDVESHINLKLTGKILLKSNSSSSLLLKFDRRITFIRESTKIFQQNISRLIEKNFPMVLIGRYISFNFSL